MSRFFTLIFIVCLSMICIDFALPTEAKTSVETHPNISAKQLTGIMNDNLSQHRLVIPTMQKDGNFTLISFPSVLTKWFELQCVEPYFDVPPEDVELALSWMIHPKIPQSHFVQIIAQPDGNYTIIRLRRLCAEEAK